MAHAQTITVDGNTTHQTMDGWINQLRVWDDPHVTNTYRPPMGTEDAGRSAVDIPLAAQTEILDLLYGELGLTHVQALIEGGLQPTHGGPFNFNWKRNDAQIDFVKQAQPYGLQKWIYWNLNGEPWMTDATDVNLLVDHEMAHLRRWKALGVEPAYVMLWNEPGSNGPWVTPAYYHDAVVALGRKLSIEGFSTKIVAPEGVNLGVTLNYLQAIFADAEARSYIAAISTHLYGNGFGIDELAQIRDTYAVPYGKPIWMSEYSDFTDAFDFGELMHELVTRFDVSALAYEWGFFGQWESRAHFVTLNHANNIFSGCALEKIYYTYGQFSRFVRPGDQRIDATSTESTLKASAFAAPGRLVLVVVNNTQNVPNGVSITVPTATNITSMQPVRTSESENWATLPPVLVGASAFQTDFPPRSITTFTWTDPTVTGPDCGTAGVDGGSMDGSAQSDAGGSAPPDGGNSGGGKGCVYAGSARGTGGAVPLVAGLYLLVALVRRGRALS